MKKKIIKESVGRDLVGASKFASKSSVVHKILLKYPTPDKLAVSLKEMGDNTQDPKVKAKCQELATKCADVDVQQYPKFVGKIAGLSKFWSIVGATAGAAGLTAGAAYLVKTMTQAAQDDSFKNAKGFKDSTKALMNKTGDLVGKDYTNLKKSAGDKKDEITHGIKNWLGKKVGESQFGQDTQHELNRAFSDIEANRGDIETNRENIAANKVAQDEGFAKAAHDLEVEAGKRKLGDNILLAKQNVDNANNTRRWNQEVTARMRADNELTSKLNDIPNPKQTIKTIGKNIADKETYKQFYGPIAEKSKETINNGAKAVKDGAKTAWDWWSKLPEVDYGRYSGT